MRCQKMESLRVLLCGGLPDTVAGVKEWRAGGQRDERRDQRGANKDKCTTGVIYELRDCGNRDKNFNREIHLKSTQMDECQINKD